MVKGCVIKTATHATFDHVFLASRVVQNSNIISRTFALCAMSCRAVGGWSSSHDKTTSSTSTGMIWTLPSGFNLSSTSEEFHVFLMLKWVVELRKLHFIDKSLVQIRGERWTHPVFMSIAEFAGSSSFLQMSSCVTGMAPLFEVQRSER